MDRKLILTLMISILALSVPALSMDPHSDHNMKNMKHDGMSAAGVKSMLGSQIVAGVNSTSSIKDVSAAMAKMGMAITHHIMIGFNDVETGDAVKNGVVAIKVKGPDGKDSKAIKLMSMAGKFGADITLPAKGSYTFMIGTKLADGVKRTYHYNFMYH